MRTTLKRGVGRLAKRKWPRHAAAGRLTAVSHYRQPRRRGGNPGLIARILFFLLAAFTSLAIGIAGGYWLEGEQTVDIDRASRKDPQIRKAAQKLDVALPGRPAMQWSSGRTSEVGQGRGRGGRAGRSC